MMEEHKKYDTTKEPNTSTEAKEYNYKVVSDDSQILLSNIAFVKQQLAKSIIDAYGCVEWDKNELSNELSYNSMRDRTKYDNIPYKEKQIEEGIPENLIDGDQPIGWLIAKSHYHQHDEKLIEKDYVEGQIHDIVNGVTNYSTPSLIQNNYGPIPKVDPNKDYGKWNVQQSINWIIMNSAPKSQHACAKFVRMALEAGGLSTAGRPNAAQDYHLNGFLAKIGFEWIATLPDKAEQARWTSQYAQPGDISVMQAPSHNWGHICLWTGSQWISDFRQNHMRPYASAGMHTTACWIYRWHTLVSK